MAAQFAQRPPDERRDITEALITAQGTDFQRWSEPENLKMTWARRAEMAARLVPPGARILDIGCGAMDLERFLDSSVTYIPADVIKRDERTLLCDLNTGELPAIEVDIITLLGVLEYVHDIPGLFARLRRTSASLIVSYNSVDLSKAYCDRRAQGWFNDFTCAELCAQAAETGFRVVGIVTIPPQHLCELRPA